MEWETTREGLSKSKGSIVRHRKLLMASHKIYLALLTGKEFESL